MKTLIYISLLVVLLLLGGGVLLVYYTQPFTEDFDFASSIPYSSIQIQTEPPNNYGQTEETLRGATAAIGNLSLKNNGYFEKVYVLPYLVGCIDLKPGAADNPIKDYDVVAISYSPGPNQWSGGKQKVTVNSGDDLKMSISAQYSSWLPASHFSRDSISGISIYRLDQREDNPLSSGDYSYRYLNNYYPGTSCADLRRNFKPVARILVE